MIFEYYFVNLAFWLPWQPIKLSGLDWNDMFEQQNEHKNQKPIKIRTYKLFKTSFKKENYLSLLLDKQSLFSFSRLRISNHKLEIKLGWYKNIPPEERYCRLCNLYQVEDEFHFIMSCSVYSEHREQLFQQIKDFVPSFDILPLSEKFVFLMGADNPEILTPLIKFVKKCSDIRKDMFTKMQSAIHLKKVNTRCQILIILINDTNIEFVNCFVFCVCSFICCVASFRSCLDLLQSFAFVQESYWINIWFDLIWVGYLL